MKLALRTTVNATAFLALPLLALTLSTIDTKAQANRQVTAIERRVQTMDQQSKQYELENMGRDDKKPKVDAKRAREIKNEIGEDLNALQTAYNEIVLSLQDKTEITNDRVNSQSANIRKRATRLKANLALPKPEEPTSPIEESTLAMESPKKQLRSLAKMVYELITNPIFESTSGLDVKLAGKATQDLDALIAFTTVANQ
jgi:hypothetical protein